MKTGIKFKGCNIGQSEAHNQRLTAYVEALEKKYHGVHFRQDLTCNNQHWNDPSYKPLKELHKDLAKMVKEKTGRKMQDKASPIREGCPPIKPNTRIQDFDKFRIWMESKGLHIISIDLHFDEGHYANQLHKEGWMPNNHAHIVVDWMDHVTGKAVNLSRQDCRDMQTVLADSLGMERGTPKDDSAIEAMSAIDYKIQQKEMELETKKAQLQQLKEDIKDIKNQISLKKEAKNAVGAFFDRMSNNDKVKSLEAEIEALNGQISDYKQKLDDRIEENKKYLAENELLKRDKLILKKQAVHNEKTTALKLFLDRYRWFHMNIESNAMYMLLQGKDVAMSDGSKLEWRHNDIGYYIERVDLRKEKSNQSQKD